MAYGCDKLVTTLDTFELTPTTVSAARFSSRKYTHQALEGWIAQRKPWQGAVTSRAATVLLRTREEKFGGLATETEKDSSREIYDAGESGAAIASAIACSNGNA